MFTLFINIIGWIGVALLLLSYALVSTRKLEGDSLVYQWLNISGAVMLVCNSFYFGAMPSVGVNLAWIGIAIFALLQSKKKKREYTTSSKHPDKL